MLLNLASISKELLAHNNNITVTVFKMHQELSNRNKFCFHIFFRDLNHGLLEDDMSVPTNGCSFASYRQNVDADMCMAILIFDGIKWEFAAMPYRTRDVAEQLGDLVNSNLDGEIHNLHTTLQQRVHPCER